MTQNIDGLHAQAGTQELIEVHGSISHSSCLECLRQYELEDVRARLAAEADGVPRCDCGQPLKPDVVLFGEFLPEAAMDRATELAERADVLLCVGSSLEVYPVAGLPSITLRAGGALAIVTQSATQYDGRAAVRLSGDVVAELEAVVAALVAGEPAADDERHDGGQDADDDELHAARCYRLGVAEQDADRRDHDAAERDLDQRRAHRHVQEALADPRDRDQLDRDDGVGDRQRGREVGDQEGEGVGGAADERRRAGDEAAARPSRRDR